MNMVMDLEVEDEITGGRKMRAGRRLEQLGIYTCMKLSNFANNKNLD